MNNNRTLITKGLPIETKGLWNTERAAKYLDLSPNTLRNWRHLGKGPNWVSIGRYPKYDPVDLKNFVEENRVTV